MADVKKNDTWPPLRGRAEDQNGDAIDLTAADETLIFMRHKTTPSTFIQGTVTPYVQPDSDGFNWEFVWRAGDTAVIGDYDTELQVTWDAGSTPPKVETIPNNRTNNPTITVWEDID
jgi:hypothetical protein